MFGFTVKYSSETLVKPSQEKSILFQSKVDETVVSFEYNALKKFENDKLFQENANFIMGIDGVVLNLKSLKNNYGISNYFELIIYLFQKRNIQFVDEIKGQFYGFIFDKNKEELYFFNNKTDTKQIFYSQDENGTIISNFFKEVCSFRKENKLNQSAVYDMLSFGGMLEEKTFVKDVSKLLAGEYLKVKNHKIEVKKYFDYNEIPISIHSKKEAINLFDKAFKEAVKLEFEKDEEYNFAHLSTLSGGLDSRMTVMLADKMNYKSKTICFSQSGYYDELIARRIAKDLNLEFEFLALDGSLYLKDLEKMVACNAGLQFYNGSAHYNFALEQLNLNNFGLIHTGQIGDGLLGGFVTKEKNFLSKTITNKYLDKSIYKNYYRDEEIFKLYNRVFNLANFGSFVVERNGTYLTSPFLDDDVMQIGLSINPKHKFNQEIYINWINEKHLEVTKYKWERTGLKPNAAWKTDISRYTKKIQHITKKLQSKENLLSMTPDEYWFKKSKHLQDFYANYFNENIGLLENDKSIFEDVKSYYENGGLDEKSVVLTILETVRQFDIEV